MQIFAMYRQLVAEALAERETISKSSRDFPLVIYSILAYLCDPLIATFPRAAADLDLLSMFQYELNRKKILQVKEATQVVGSFMEISRG